MTKFNKDIYIKYYLIALIIIGLIMIVSHGYVTYVLYENKGLSKIINVSGKQRMYSQRIVSLAYQNKFNNTNVTNLLQKAIQNFEKAHIQLTKIEQNHNNNINNIYFSRSIGLDSDAIKFINIAKEIIRIDKNNPKYNQLLNKITHSANGPLLAKLDKIVSEYQSIAELKLKSINFLLILTLIIIMITLFAEALFIFKPMINKIAKYADELYLLAAIDKLTNLYNRSFFLKNTKKIISNNSNNSDKNNLGVLIMIDIDNFKQINDNYGHGTGDLVLIQIGQIINSNIRKDDLAARFGGEEFLIFINNQDHKLALSIANRIKENISKSAVDIRGNIINFTASFGIEIIKHTDSFDTVYKRVDYKLYKAKSTGKNKIIA